MTILTGVAIVLQDFKEVYVSSRNERGGHSVLAEGFKPEANSFGVPILDPATDQSIGVVYISLDPEILYHAVDNTRGHIPMAVTVTSPFDTEIFHIGERVNREHETGCWCDLSWLSGSGGSSQKFCFTRNGDQLCFDCGLEPSLYCHSLSDFEADLC